MPKHSPFCYTHKEAAEAAKSNPESLQFRKIVLDFEAKCASQGKGKPRARYNFCTMLEEWRAASKETKEKKRKMMDYIDFKVHMMTKRLKTEQQADTLWLAYLNDPKVPKDRNGLNADGEADVRVEVVKGDYGISSESLEQAKVMQCEVEKMKKPDQAKLDGAFNKVVSGHASMEDSEGYFADFRQGRLSDPLQEPLALQDSKGRAVVKLSCVPGLERKGSEPSEELGDGSSSGSSNRKSLKVQAQLASAKSGALASLDSAYRTEEEAGMLRALRLFRETFVSFGCLSTCTTVRVLSHCDFLVSPSVNLIEAVRLATLYTLCCCGGGWS